MSFQINGNSARLVKVPSDGACFFHAVIAANISGFPTTVEALRNAVCDFLFTNKNRPILFGSSTPFDRVMTLYGPDAGVNPLHVVDPDLKGFRQYVTSFENWISAMRQPHAFADEIIVEGLSNMLGVSISVWTSSQSSQSAQPVLKTGNKSLDDLLAMGYSMKTARKALESASGNMDQALEALLSMPPKAIEAPVEKKVYRCVTYNSGSAQKIDLLNERDHYELLIFESSKPSKALPPTPAPVKSHKPPPSFGHHQPQTAKPAKLPKSRLPIDGSQIGGFNESSGLYDQIIALLREMDSCDYPTNFEISRLSLIHADLCNATPGGVQIFGSFGFHSSREEFRYRAVGFTFLDGSKLEYSGDVKSLSDPKTKEAFVARVVSNWRTNLMIGITFQRCNL